MTDSILRCSQCCGIKHRYHTNVSSYPVPPIAAMSITSDHPSIGRSSLEAIEKWVEAAISKRDIHLEPITTIPTGVATQPLDVSIPGSYTGIGDAASTVIGASVFDSIISAAATETETVSAIGGSAATASNTPTSSAATGQMSTGRSSHDSP